jgi:hypothetical protein
VIPTTMTIPAGSASGTFTASGNYVAQPTTVTVSTNNSNISPNPSTNFTVNPFQVRRVAHRTDLGAPLFAYVAKGGKQIRRHQAVLPR